MQMAFAVGSCILVLASFTPNLAFCNLFLATCIAYA